MKNFLNFILIIGAFVLSTVSFSFAYTQEQIEAFQWAYQNRIISQPDIQVANLNGNITRQSLSKMVINYIEKIVGIPGDISDLCSFSDENKITNDLKYQTKRICAYQIMGKNRSAFNPTKPVTRAQLGTVLSRVLWGDRHNSSGKGYYIYHLNALQDAGIMNNIKNVSTPAKRGDVLIMLKRIYDKFGANIYLNSGNTITTITTPSIPQSVNTERTNNSNKESNNDYTSDIYNNANIIYTGKDGTKYYYDDKFLAMLKTTAEKKGESDLAKYLEIEARYFKNGLDQLSDLDDEELLKSMGIDVDNIDPEKMTDKEKQDLIKKFKSGLEKIIEESKTRNNNLLKDLEKITKNINKDQFGLKEKYKETKTFMEATNNFLDLYSKSILDLIEIALTQDEEDSQEGMAQAFGLIGIALAYQGEADKYQKYVEEWAVDTLKTLGIN